MKSMKYLLRLIGALALTITAATSAVACGQQEKNDQEEVAAIKKKLEAGIDGSSLNSSQKFSDAQSLIQSAADSVVKGAAFKIDTPDESLLIGDNIISIQLTFKTIKNSPIAVKLTNVYLSDQEEVAAIKKKLEAGIDGSSLNSSQKFSDAQALIQSAADSVVKGAAFKIDTPDEILVIGDNIISIQLTFKTIKNSPIAVKLTNVVKK